MELRRLQIAGLRSIESLSVEAVPGLNLIVGPNGSGKSSILEAIHLLGFGRSFRGRRLGELVRHGANGLLVHGDLMAAGGEPVSVGLSAGSAGRRVRMDGQEVLSSSLLAQRLPLLAVTPESQRLIGDGARQRRQLLDWTLFHVEPGYLALLKRYRRAVAQRNVLLRLRPGRGELAAWDDELGRSGEALAGLRERHREAIGREVQGFAAEVGLRIDLELRRGWAEGVRLERALRDHLEADLRRGATGVGPHRADYQLRVGGRAVHGVLSRGEGKRAAIALLVGHLRFLSGRITECPLLLVDDLASEVDAGGRRLLLGALRELGLQLFVTALESGLIARDGWPTARLFHVEQGRLASVV